MNNITYDDPKYDNFNKIASNRIIPWIMGVSKQKNKEDKLAIKTLRLLKPVFKVFYDWINDEKISERVIKGNIF